MAAATTSFEISAIILASLSGLFGIYIVLFVLALWTINRHSGQASRRLKLVTIVLFVDLLAHFIIRSLQFYRARVNNNSDHETYAWSTPLMMFGNITKTFAGLLSDGLLVWRFYVIYGHQNWTLYVSGTAVILNALLCWSADLQHLTIYFDTTFYENTLLDINLDIIVAWGWFMFTINTVLTWAIIRKLLQSTRPFRRTVGEGSRRPFHAYETILRAFVESAMVTWIGLLLYEICSLAPTGHITSDLDVGYVMLNILPVFFGIAQTLITVRVGLSTELITPPLPPRISCFVTAPTLEPAAKRSPYTPEQHELDSFELTTVTPQFEPSGTKHYSMVLPDF